MKNYDNIEKDAAFLRANIDTYQERIRLPESLSEQNIADLVSGKKQRRNKKAIVRRFVGLAAAACIAVGIFTALDYGVYAPKQLPVTEDNGLAYAQSYDDIVSIVVLLATFGLCAWLSAKIYRIGILMFGKKSTWKDLWKWLKQK